MPGYTPGEQIADLVKLNTNEGAFPPVAAGDGGAGGDRRRIAAPLPRSDQPAACATAAAARFGVTPEQVLAGNGSDDCLTIVYRGVPRRPASASPAPGRPTASTTRWRRCRGRSWCGVPFRQSGRRFELPDDLATPARQDDHPRQPQQPVGDAGAGRRAAPACATPRRGHRRRRRGLRRLRAGRRASTPACSPTSTQHPNLVVLRTMSKSYSLAGARLGLLFAAAPLVEALTKVKDSYNVNALTQALGIAALEDRATTRSASRRTLDQRARLEAALGDLGLTWPESAANFLLVRDRRARRGDLPGAQARGAAGPLVARPRAAHQAPHQRRQARRQRPPARRARPSDVILYTLFS